MAEFTHLHLHTQYSLLDGAIRVKDLFPRVLELGMDSVAVTDHGNMHGAVDLYNASKKHGVKLIFGCETYITPDRFDRTVRRSSHLTLLAKNEVGYRNLSYLNSMGHLEGFYYNPRIDKPLLREHTEGLIGMSACLGGEVAKTLLHEGVAKAEEVIKEYRDIFAPGDFYLEVMPNGLPEQETVNEEYRRLGPKLGVPLVATNDCHYVHRSDARAQEILISIQTGKTESDEKRLRHDVDEFFLKSPAEMEAPFKDLPEALENSVKIASQCNVELQLGKTVLPQYKVPEGHDLETYLEDVARRGLDDRFAAMQRAGLAFDPDEYRARLAHELGVIKSMGFPGYFLIVWDFINWAKEHKIPVGPGRGSGAGSLVAYAMRITDLDPIRYKLIFERFLNPERITMPDFDVDFCMNRRDEVIEYVKQKYGANRVGQIATFHQLKARGVIRDIARVMEIPFSEADKLAKLVPEPVQGKSPAVRDAIEQVPELKKLYQEDGRMHELLDVADALQGLNRHAGMHAAGVVIAEEPLTEYVPCFRGKNDEIVTQFSMGDVEKVGLVKFDFLGLKTLTVIDTAVRLINEQREAAGEPLFEIDKIPTDDADVYRLVSDGDTTGVFQLESSGFREILQKLKPDCLEDIVAAVALYRPGPLEGGMVDDFIDRKHGRKQVEYPHPSLEPILADTYGVIVYQEQVMKIAQVLAGYSLGGADLLRRAMGKKKVEIMAEEKKKFLSGADERGIDTKLADQIFELIAKFAGYGFNRSHSVAYAWIAYQTAFLKRHYPHEFMAGLMSCDQDNTDKIVKFIAAARAMGLTVEPPDVNESASDFTVHKKQAATDEGEADEEAASEKVIRFGLGAVKGVGHGAVEAVLEAREEDGPFQSLFSFCERVDSHKCNRRVIEALIKSGAFDSVADCGAQGQTVDRACLFATIERAMERGAQAQRDRRTGQTSLFGLLAAEGEGKPASETQLGDEKYAEVEPWSPKQLLAFEKEALGFYVSGHPLDRYSADLSRYANASTVDFVEGNRGSGDAAIGGIVAAYRETPTKRGDGKCAFFSLEDVCGQLEVVCFPKTFEKVRHVLVSDEPILCSGTVRNEEVGEQSVWKLFLEDAVPLAELRRSKTKRVDINLNADACTPEQIEALRVLLASSRGTCRTVLRLQIPRRSETVIVLGENWSVAPTDELLTGLERLFGAPVAQLA